MTGQKDEIYKQAAKHMGTRHVGMVPELGMGYSGTKAGTIIPGGIEDMIQAKGMTAPRVTPERINAVIADEIYIKPTATLTICVLTLQNGFTVTGESACASPANYDREIGERIARENAVQKIWPLEGYLLKQKLQDSPLIEVQPALDAKIDRIARTTHEVNRAYCLSLGDTSQVSWFEAPDWQKDSARVGVKMHLENPNATAEDSHNAWLEQKKADGWQWGPVKDPEAKRHPCFKPYHLLPKAQQTKDYLFKAVIDALR